MALNYEQPTLEDLSDELVLEWWSRPAPGGGYREVVAIARHHQVQTTIPKVKRSITRRLRRLGLIPKIPTSADYERAKVRWREAWFSQDFI